MKFMFRSYKILKINLVFILFIACNTSSNLDDESSPIYSTESNIIENQELNSIISNESPLSLLALGDSYTIGEGVNEEERWPNQFVQVAYENGIDFLTPRIIAMTGWKTYDLINGIESSNFEKKYDYVSLLIGVNNQFNSRSINEFEDDLDKLLIKINNLKKKDGSVLIISIPDWGSSPYGENMDRNQISTEINTFNNSLKSFANINGLKYVDVTEISRRAINESNLITSDNLHPSGLMYLEWAKKIFNVWIN
ncbi:MAG: SGNH/GDSL hydrolase family protein [Flavobacteriales bacterium]|nr:MAG: SGNH/GDSL hydrolase family protein [Flavobacteriales bacterium]